MQGAATHSHVFLSPQLFAGRAYEVLISGRLGTFHERDHHEKEIAF